VSFRGWQDLPMISAYDFSPLTVVTGISDLFSGIPTQVVVPSVSRAAALQGLAGTITVAVPSLAGSANPVVELAGCSATP
jgi:hypothetical protein